jgi:hypothetical protein
MLVIIFVTNDPKVQYVLVIAKKRHFVDGVLGSKETCHQREATREMLIAI